jgi:FkbM family methyltransferase
MLSIIKTINFLYSHPLTKGRGFGVLLKFFSWQFSNLFFDSKKIFSWVNESKLIMRKGETSVTGNYYNGLLEYEDMMFLLHTMKPENVFIDVGANAGVYSVLASKVLGSKSIAFEPINETFERLIDNININRISEKVKTINKGVGSKPGELYFTNNHDTTNKVSNINEENTSKVSITTLDKEIDTEIEASLFLKIDVEGFEMEVLKGARELLKSGKVSIIIIELNGSGEEFGYTDNDIHMLISSFGFKPISYNPIKREVYEIKTPSEFGNTIYVKELDQVINLCIEAENVLIHSAFNKVI